MDLTTRWLGLLARRSNEHARANARVAATACSRRRLERAEVEEYLRRLRPPPAVHASAAAVRPTSAVH